MGAPRKKDSYPRRSLLLAISLVFASISGNLFYQHRTNQIMERSLSRLREIDRAVDSMVRARDIRNSSARLAAFSGFTWWENEYSRARAEFSRSYLELKELLPGLADPGEAAGQDRLLAINDEIFRLVRSARLQEARALVTSLERDTLVRRLGFYLAGVRQQAERLSENTIEELHQRELRHAIVEAVTLLLLLGLSLAISAILRAWARELESSNELLDRTVREKIAELDLERSRAVASSRLVELGEMAGGIAHEINTPLAIIGTSAAQLGELFADEASDRGLIQERLTRIEKTVQRIARIVSGLRRIARDGSEDPVTPVDLSQVVHAVGAICGERLRNEGVRIELQLPEGENRVECREVQISQVLLNLVNNAADAIRGTPEPWIRIGLSRIDGWTELSVADNGPGLSPEARQKIFQPFFTTKPVGQGTGLGLSVSRGIATEHGGELFLDERSPGTRFVLRLPTTGALRSRQAA